MVGLAGDADLADASCWMLFHTHTQGAAGRLTVNVYRTHQPQAYKSAVELLDPSLDAAADTPPLESEN